MRFVNEYDVRQARSRFTRAACPNRLALAIMVDQLADWTNHNSDGWAYWPKPLASAQAAIAHIESRTWAENKAQEADDISHREMILAARPVRTFLTRHQSIVTPDDREQILRSVTL